MLNAIYEEDFLGFSYGFRPGRGQHDALDALAVGIEKRKVNFILDADIQQFFDRVSQEWLVRFLNHRIGDQCIIRLVQKWLKAGVLEEGIVTTSEQGMGQGSVASPLLANLYLHYVFDLWANRWRQRSATGNMIIVRYADDIVVGFEREADAHRFQTEMRERLEKFSLSPEKTRLMTFGRYAVSRRRERGLGKPETFDFLGFTHICGKSRRGEFQLLRKSRRDRMRAKLREIEERLRWLRNRPVREQAKWLRQVVRGYFEYHAVPANLRSLRAFREHVIFLWKLALRRRGQMDTTSTSRVEKLAAKWLPIRKSCIRGQASASPSNTQGRSRMREFRMYGSVRGALSNERPYRDPSPKPQSLSPWALSIGGLALAGD